MSYSAFPPKVPATSTTFNLKDEGRSSDQPVGRSKPPVLTRITKDTWLWEILSLLFSIACLVASAVVLRVYDGRSLPKWPYGITLTLISLLATLVSMAMMVPVAAGLSQSKWLWFARPGSDRGTGRGKRLADFGAFDMASRGPWGCILLLKTAWSS